ncbi:MAG: acyl-CoA desaturase [Lentisphaerae bacterium]|nr:acyl-CoA desaturase [Lentisphaerota bacterium]
MNPASPQMVRNNPVGTPGITVSGEGIRAAQRRMALFAIVTPTVGTVAALVLAGVQGVTRMEIGLLVSMFFLTTMGVEVGFHRLVAHRAFKTSTPVKVILTALGSMAGEGSVLYWAAGHRRHHMHSDTGNDPHSPHIRNLGQADEPMNALQGLWHAHVAWMVRDRVTNCTFFARDVLCEPYLNGIHRAYIPLLLAGLALPAAVGWAISGTGMGALQGFLWGGLLRMFLVHHASWANASFSHRYGSRPFATGDKSANNLWWAIPTFGASYQNNHHCFPGSAYLGLRWWQIDVGALCIRALAALRLVWDISGPPTPEMMAEKRVATPGGDGGGTPLPSQSLSAS